MAEPSKPRRVAVPKKGVTPRGRVAMPVDPSRSTGGKALGKTKGKAQGKAVGHTKPQPKSLGPETAAVRKKYESTLAMRKEAAAGKGAKGKADLIAWKRSSGYQKDWNAAKANDIAASKPRPTTGDFDPKYIAFMNQRAKQLRESGQGRRIGPVGSERLDTRMGAKPGSGVEEFKKIDRPDRMDFRQGAKPGSGVEEPQPVGANAPGRMKHTATDMQGRIKAAGLAPKAMPKRKTGG